EGSCNDNGFFGGDYSPQDIGTGLEIGDAVNTCRGNHFLAVTIEGSAGATNFNVSASAVGTILEGFYTTAATNTVNASATGTRIYTSRTGTLRFGHTIENGAGGD